MYRKHQREEKDLWHNFLFLFVFKGLLWVQGFNCVRITKIGNKKGKKRALCPNRFVIFRKLKDSFHLKGEFR